MLLRSGTTNLDVIGLANALLREAGSLAGLTKLTTEDFQKFPGIGKVRALQLVTVAEIVRRVWQAEEPPKPILDEPTKVMRLMNPRVFGLEVEKFWALSLNTRNRLIRSDEITSGTATASLVHPREVFRHAIKAGATAIICVHNHPSGDPGPSRADLQVTQKLKAAAAALEIDLLDHIIIGFPQNDPKGLGYYSFLENGLM
jgi:DNA repair protein RadC